MMEMNKENKVYIELIQKLGYENNSSYRVDESGIYDECFFITINNEEYPVVGIKFMDEVEDEEIWKQHIIFWNRNDVPISILVFPYEYRIYNNFSLKKGKVQLFSSNDKKHKSYDLLSKLSSSNITTRLVWEELTRLSEPSDRVDRQLLNNLKNTVIQVHEEQGMQLDVAYNFMSQCIFVKYLEDRGMITSKVFERWHVNNFTEFLEKGSCKGLFDFFCFLKKRFNGDLFLVEQDEIPNVKQLDIFYRFFRGDDIYDNGSSQLKLFPYNFSVIPISLISNIYETFLSMDDEKNNEKKAADVGAFYTPSYLADFITYKGFGEISKLKDIPNILDPACGSGVFLVNAFKNQINVLKHTEEIVTPEKLCQIMTSMIYGVDINISALKISCFSLYIALLDELMPKDIIENKFSFPNLIGYNLIEGSFFSNEVEEKLVGKKFDLIVGNPPWKSMPYSDHISYCQSNRIPIADAQIAQAFICRVKDFANENSKISLLITNSIFTNSNSKRYLDYVLSNFSIEHILNLENVKAQLFAHASYPCSIITYNCKKQEEYVIKYCTFQTNVLFRLLHKFVYDKSNEIGISNHKLIENEYLWRVLTYGDEFDAECISELKKFPELSQSIGSLDFVQGYITANKGKTCDKFNGYKGGSLKGCFSPYGIDYENVPKVMPDVKYDRPRDLSIYTCKHKVLIKRTYNEKCWGAAYVTEPLIFSNDFSTFNDYTGENINLLRYLEGILNSKVFRYYIYYVSKVKAAKKPEVVKDDVLHFPMPIYDENNNIIIKIASSVELIEKEVRKSWENINVFGVSDKIEVLKEELDQLIFELYKLDEFQKSVIIEGIERFITDNKNINYADNQDYVQFADYISQYFNYYMSIDLNYKWKYQVQEGQFYSVIRFFFTEEATLEKNFVDLAGLIGVKSINQKLLIQKQILIFEEDGFQIIQSKDKNNWSVRKAMRVAAKITKQIMQTGDDL